MRDHRRGRKTLNSASSPVSPLDLRPALLETLQWRSFHGTLVQVGGVGVLLEGPSGSGKSEIALELLAHGHRWIADDVVQIAVHPSGALVGRAQETIREWMEIRGVGLFRVTELYGAEVVLPAAMIDFVCRIESWGNFLLRPRIEARETADYCGVLLPVFRMPQPRVVTPTTLLELMVRQHRWEAKRVTDEKRSFFGHSRGEGSQA